MNFEIEGCLCGERNPSGTMNPDDCWDETRSLQSPVVEFVIGQDAIGESDDSGNHRQGDFIRQRNWTADGTPALVV